MAMITNSICMIHAISVYVKAAKSPKGSLLQSSGCDKLNLNHMAAITQREHHLIAEVYAMQQ